MQWLECLDGYFPKVGHILQCVCLFVCVCVCVCVCVRACVVHNPQLGVGMPSASLGVLLLLLTLILLQTPPPVNHHKIGLVSHRSTLLLCVLSLFPDLCPDLVSG